MLLVAIALACCETLLRTGGYDPGVNKDDAALWASARRTVRANDPKQVVLLGASRMQQDVVPDVLAKELGEGFLVAQLSVVGARELPLLEHLANDESFIGIILFSIKPEHVEKSFLEGGPETRNRASDFIEYYHNESPSDILDSAISGRVRRLLLSPGSLETGLLPVIRRKLSGEDPPQSRYGPGGITVHENRWVAADYNSKWGEKKRARKWKPRSSDTPITEKEVAEYSELVSGMIEDIEERGGKVILVRLPSSGYERQQEQEKYPRAAVWDRIARGAGAPSIHFEDYPELSSYTCGDGSHLDMRDAPEFTKAFAKIVLEKIQ